MTRAPRQIGDSVVIVAVDGSTSPKKYELIPSVNNYSYDTVSDQPEVEINQPLDWPLSFHAGAGYSKYHPRTAPGFAISEGLDTDEPNTIRAPVLLDGTTLGAGAANPPQYFFETTVNDGGADDGQPVKYIIANEAAEVNVYKVSLDSGDFGTLLNTKTFSVTPTQPCGQPAEWNDGSNTKWYLGLGDSTNRMQRLTTIVSSTAADTWTASGDADARHLKVVGNRLMRSTDENQISLLPRASDPLTEANWGSDFFVGDVSANITELGEAGGLAYAAKEDGFYEWDTLGQADNILPAIGRASRNGQGMVYWHGGFWIPAASGLWWTRTGRPEGMDSNPHYRANLDAISSGRYLKHGRWMGLAPFGAYIYGLYVDSTGETAVYMQGRERDDTDPPGWGNIIWHAVSRAPIIGFVDFQGLFVAELSEFSSTETRPVLFGPGGTNGVQLAYVFLDKDGTPQMRKGDTDLDGNPRSVFTGNFDFDHPRILKQLRVIEGIAEGFPASNALFKLRVYRDGGSAEQVGADITADGRFERFWTQDSNDTMRSMVMEVRWEPGATLTNTDAPRLRDIVIRALALPDTAQVWTFNFYVRDSTVKTAKKIRSELEGYLQDLKQYELPDGDTVNGVMTSVRLLRADEVRDLFSDMQPPPKYVLQAQVRQMVSS